MYMKITVLILAIACFTSYIWGVQRFFMKSELNFKLLSNALYILVPIFIALHIYAILTMQDLSLSRTAIASILYLTSFVLYWWAIKINFKSPLSFGLSKGLPNHLVKQGPYQIVRHPFYTSYILIWVAGIIATKQYYLLITLGVMFSVYWFEAYLEEKNFLQSELAGEYKVYSRNVGMFFPKLHRLIKN